MVTLQDFASIRKTDLAQNRATLKGTTLLYHLNTLYSAQKRAWLKYEDQWARFEKDHLNNEAPIPASAQFLLVHMIGKVDKKTMFESLRS